MKIRNYPLHFDFSPGALDRYGPVCAATVFHTLPETLQQKSGTREVCTRPRPHWPYRTGSVLAVHEKGRDNEGSRGKQVLRSGCTAVTVSSTLHSRF